MCVCVCVFVCTTVVYTVVVYKNENFPLLSISNANEDADRVTQSLAVSTVVWVSTVSVHTASGVKRNQHLFERERERERER